MYPSTVALDAGTVSCTASNTVFSITIDQTLTKGWYWLAANTTSAATTNNYFGIAVSNIAYGEVFSKTPWANAFNPAMTQTGTNVTSGFSTASATPTSATPYHIALRKS
jgi:hypothetical protein